MKTFYQFDLKKCIENKHDIFANLLKLILNFPLYNMVNQPNLTADIIEIIKSNQFNNLNQDGLNQKESVYNEHSAPDNITLIENKSSKKSEMNKLLKKMNYLESKIKLKTN